MWANPMKWLRNPHKKETFHLRETSARDVDNVGTKAGYLADVSRLALPVPEAFVIGADASLAYHNAMRAEKLNEPSDEKLLSHSLMDEVNQRILDMNNATSKLFGSTDTSKFPLLLSVRASHSVRLPELEASGPFPFRFSTLSRQYCLPSSWDIPGIQHSILNIGMNDEVANVLAKMAGPRFAFDTYARFLMQFGVLIKGADPTLYYTVLKQVIEASGKERLQVSDLQYIITTFKQIQPITSDLNEQVALAIESIYKKWFSECNDELRHELFSESPDLGVAVLVQSMVFGNLSVDSGTGMMTTRDPWIGDRALCGQFLANAEGEDLIVSSRQPLDMRQLSKERSKLHHQLENLANSVEAHFRDALEIEYAMQGGMLYITCVRPARRAPRAAVKVAIDLVNEGLITQRESVMHIPTQQIAWFEDLQMQKPSTGPNPAAANTIAKGHPTNFGLVCGKLAFDAKMVREIRQVGGAPPVLCLTAFPDQALVDKGMMDSPEIFNTVYAIKESCGVILIDEGPSSRGALLCRAMGKPCLSKVPALSIQRDGAPELLVDGQRSNLTSETLVTLDATNGTLLLGRAEFVPSGSNTHLDCLMEYADRFREMRVDAIVNSVEDADHAIKVGPDGVLLSTDYLLSELNARASLLTRYLLTEDEATRSSLLMLIEDNHREQLITLMRRFHRIRISVRLLDLPLSTFLPMPSDDQAMNKLAEEMNLSVHWLRMRILALRDTNPQAGLRGARVFALFPSLLNVQVRAIIGAAKALLSNESLEVRPTIVVPTVATSQEVATIVRKIHSFAQLFLDGAPGGGPAKRKFDDQQRVQQMQAEEAKNGDVSVEMETPAEAPGVYSVGTMLTTPRSLIRIQALEEHVDTLTFDLLELTERCFGANHTDAEKFVIQYLHTGCFQTDPFRALDERGVGEIVRETVTTLKTAVGKGETGFWGRHSAPKLPELSVLALPGADSSAIPFLSDAGITTYICAPKAVRAARVAAAQVAIKASGGGMVKSHVPVEDLYDVYTYF